MKNIFIRRLLVARKNKITPAMTFYPRQMILFLLCCTVLFVSGCAPGVLLIRDADLTNMDQRLSHQTALTAKLIEVQKKNQEILIRLTENVDENKGCEPMIPILEAILENQITNQGLLEEIPKKLDALESRKIPYASPPATAPPRTLETSWSQKIIVGAVEKVRISPPGLIFTALMDTGAEVSSIDARNIERFERDGQRWVRFDLLHPETGEMIPIEQKIERKTRILQSISGEFDRRIVVELSFAFGDITQVAEFTLTDRSHLSYPVLIGRNILKDVMVVDVSRSNGTVEKSKKPIEKKAKK